MKKKLSILLTLIILFAYQSAFSFSYSDVSGNEYEEDIILLSTIGIAESFYENEFLPDKSMSRADFCKMLVDMTGEVSADKIYYKDVSFDHAAFNQISYAYAQNIMIGYGDGIFKPDEPVKLGEAVKVLISFMGYNFKTDGSIVGAVQLGRQLGLLSGLKASYTEELTRGMACRLIKNSLDIPIPEISAIGKAETYKIGNMTLLKKYKNMDIGKGIVDANEFVSLKGRPLAIENCIRVNGENLRIRDISDIELVGSEIEYICLLNDDEEPYDLIYVKINEADVLVVEREDYLSFNNNLFVYELGEREKDIKISPEADFFYNGEPVTFSKDIFEKVTYGRFRFVKTENSSQYDAVFIEEYKNYVVGNIKKDEKKIRDFYNPSDSIVFDEEKRKVLLYDSNNNLIGFDDIKSKQVISVAENNNIVKAFINGSIFSGTLDGIGEDTLSVDGSDYEFSYYAAELVSQLNCGEKYTWYLDMFGKIHCWQMPDEAENEYVFVIKIADGKNFEDGVKLKGYHIKNGVNTYTVSDTVVINGTPYKNLNADKLSDIIAITKTVVENEEEITVQSVNQLIVAEFNEEGKLCRINTARPLDEVDNSYNGLVLLADGSERLMYMGEDTVAKNFSYKLFMKPNTPVIMTPADIENGDDEKYETAALSRFSTFTSYPVTAYAKNPQSQYADVIVSKSVGSEVGDNSRIAVIGDYSKVCDESGNIVNKLTTITRNEEEEVLYDNDFNYIVSFNGELYDIDMLDKGDVWLYGTDADGKLSSFRLIYDVSENIFIPPFDVTNFRLSNRIIMAEITKITSDFYEIKQAGGEEIKIPLRDFLGCTVIEKAGSGYIVRKGTAADADTEDTLFVQYSSRVPYDIVILKK